MGSCTNLMSFVIILDFRHPQSTCQRICPYSLPRLLKRDEEMEANSRIVVKSPRLPAMGVATLSGFMCNFFDRITTPMTRDPKTSWNIPSSTFYVAYIKLKCSHCRTSYGLILLQRPATNSQSTITFWNISTLSILKTKHIKNIISKNKEQCLLDKSLEVQTNNECLTLAFQQTTAILHETELNNKKSYLREIFWPRIRLASDAVKTLLVMSRSPWRIFDFPLGIQLRKIAKTELRKPTTTACT